MPPLSKPSGVAASAMAFITIGALLTVWSLIGLFYMSNHDVADGLRYLDYGLLATGVVLLAIGFGAGRIGRSAREAELPPEGATPKVVSGNSTNQPSGTVARNQ